MNVEIINVGTELLLGEIVNTNATYLQKMCKELGFNVFFQTVVGDNPKKLTTIIITPASKTPSITAIVVDLKSISKILAASVPVHEPVPGSGIPTNNNKATKVLLPTFS